MKVYLGDGVYMQLEDNDIVLTTENGIETTNTIVLDQQALSNFLDIIHNWKLRRKL